MKPIAQGLFGPWLKSALGESEHAALMGLIWKKS